MQFIDEIKKKLSVLNPIQLDIQDDSALHLGHKGNGGGGHFSLTIQSANFNGLSMVARHREVYKLLDKFIPEKIHALSIHAIAGDE